MRLHGHASGRGRRCKRSLTYNSWRAMIARCYYEKHPNYGAYGGAGVRVFFDWLGPGGFQSFLEHVGERPSRAHSLDRIDSHRGYEPGNVRWVTENYCDTTRSLAGNVVSAIGPTGELWVLPLSIWAERLGLRYRSLLQRMRRARSDEERARVFRTTSHSIVTGPSRR